MKRIGLIVIVMVGAAALAWFWRPRPAASAPAEDNGPVAAVQVTPLRRQSITQAVEAFGVVTPSPSGRRLMAATYDCVVQRLTVAAGTRVTAGEELMELVPSSDAALALATAQSGLKLAQEALTSVQQRFDLKLATRQELLAAQQAEQEARLRLKSYRDRGLANGGRIMAPVAGVVSRIDVTVGTVVPTGGALLALATGDNLEVHLGVEPADVAGVKTGAAVTLTSADRATNAPVTGRVITAGGALDPASGAVLVRVTVPPGVPLLLGERVRATIEVKQAEGLVVPRSAVLPAGERASMFTVKDGKAVRHEVTVGMAAGDLVEVSGKGLQPGDWAVTLGNYELEDGMAVQVAPAQPERAVTPEAAK